MSGPVNANRWQARGIFAQTISAEDTEQELADSDEARTELGVPLVDQELFVGLRPPGNAASVVAQFVEAMGIEQAYVDDVREI